ncbi:MAG: tetratricopeptide repeat protein [bacterium]
MKRTSSSHAAAARWIAPLCIALVTIAAFLPALYNGFVSWDDEKNFLVNPNYRGLGLHQLSWMWTTFHMGHYVPLSWMTLGMDYLVWGMRPAGYHLTSVLIHAFDAVILYFLARRLFVLSGIGAGDEDALTLPAAFAALCFAIHPLRVESVVWVTERRDVLSLMFSLLSIIAFLRAHNANARPRHWYLASIALFLCALLSKATAMTLPAVLFVLDIYPLKRLPSADGWWSASARRVYAELLPFCALSAASVVLSIVALHPAGQLRLGDKLAVSVYSLGFYVVKTFVPLRLSPLYEMPQQVHPFTAVFLASYVLCLAITAFAWMNRRRWPWFTAGWVIFVAISLPMLGIVQNGPQIAADRYTYHAAPALAILAGAAFIRLCRAMRPMAARALGITVLVCLCALTWNQAKVWRNSETLWAQVLSLDPSSSYAHSAWASLLYEQNRVDEALDHSRRAVLLAPGLPEAHNNLGVGLARQGRLPEAIDEYRRALAIKPSYDEAQNNWGVVLARQGDVNAAVDHYVQALAVNPQYADAQVNWGNVLVRAGKPDEAITHYQAALDIRPDHAEAQFNWGVALARLGRLADAAEHFRLALAINPDHAEARTYLERAQQLIR